MEDRICARMIVEMLGAPKEYIDETLHKYIDKFKKTLKITKTDFTEPQAQGELFSVFVELEIDFKNTVELFGFCLDAMPSSVDIIAPEKLQFNAVFLSEFLNDIQAKLHDTDMFVKTLSAQNKHLDRNGMNVFRNFIMHLLKEKPKTLNELGPLMGVSPEHLKPFLDVLIREKKVVQHDFTYSIG